ncbi:MAG: hypothetical protein AB4352_00855 [Hormoscilla sp.]
MKFRTAVPLSAYLPILYRSPRRPLSVLIYRYPVVAQGMQPVQNCTVTTGLHEEYAETVGAIGLKFLQS